MTPPPEPSVSTPVQRALAQLAAGLGLGEIEALEAFGQIMAGEASHADIKELLLALRERGETAEDIAGAVRALRGAMRTVAHPRPDLLVDTCGTGGGTVSTINISTAAAFVAAGAGVPIAKHGNRSFTSRSGSADVLEALGISIDLDAERASSVLDDAGVVFLFAPLYHPAMRHVGPVRRELGVATLMNLVGPLANPAGVMRQVVGVADSNRGPHIADALARLGSLHALVVHGEIGMDEISPVGMTRMWEVRDGKVREFRFDPASVALATTSLDGLRGGEPAENAAGIRALLEHPGSAAVALRAAVLLNAAAAIYVGGRAASLAHAVDVATAALEGGKAKASLDALRRAAPHAG